MITADQQRRFWAKVNKSGPVFNKDLGACWIWTGTLARHSGGYGIADIQSKPRIAFRAHRVAYELEYGPIPVGKMLRHKCDNPPCVRPDHLIPGTAKDNSQDMIARRRHWVWLRPDKLPRGEKHWTAKKKTVSFGEHHPRAKLTNEQVLEVARIYREEGKSQRTLARQFGVSQSTIWQIVSGTNWSRVKCHS